ncbi:MAG: hypothetical protein IKX53_06180 [Bacteroidales bacterium]|nr:hypothetical protein [Bacteroidales bacterium]
MKRIVTLLFAASLCFSGCSQMLDYFNSIEMDLNQDENTAIDSTSNSTLVFRTPVWELLTDPDFDHAIIGKEGGDYEVVVYMQPKDTISRKLKNDYLFFGEEHQGKSLNEVFPFASLIGREQIDDYSVRYKFFFQENNSGSSRQIAMRVYDTTYMDMGSGAALGNIVITQTAE